MINFKCKNCGGEMSVNEIGELQCSYCGSKTVFTDRDLSDYKEFRFHLLSYLSALSDVSDSAEADRIWSRAESLTYETADGQTLLIKYLFRSEQDGVKIFTTRKNVLFVFPEGSGEKTDRFISMIGEIRYPSADIRGLNKYFPVHTGTFPLISGETVVSVSKSEECYPLAAFGSLPPEHAAWIVSRLENLCCVLAYSNISHGGINIESVFINARTHEAFLPCGWWGASRCEGGSQQDLKAVRTTAQRVMGVRADEAPEEFKRFISGKPAPTAFDDFALWDTVIRDGFKGRRFKKLDLKNLNI